MAENTKMEVEANVNETLPDEEKDEIMGEGAEGEDGSSDSEDSDANEAAVDPKIQQLELQVTSCFFCLPLILLVVPLLKTRKEKKYCFYYFTPFDNSVSTVLLPMYSTAM